jgi:hypothetical protein
LLTKKLQVSRWEKSKSRQTRNTHKLGERRVYGQHIIHRHRGPDDVVRINSEKGGFMEYRYVSYTVFKVKDRRLKDGSLTRIRAFST